MAVIYYIGTKDQYTKGYELKFDYCEQTIIEEFAKEYPLGFTITEGIGCYKHNNGEMVTEKTFIVTVLDITFANTNLIDTLKEKLNQECIAVQVIEDSTMFI